MKLLFVTIVLSVSSLAYSATTNPQDCLKITNNLDRKYCTDKYLESVKDKLTAEKKTWSTGITADVKAAKTTAVEQEIQSKRDYAALINAEVALNEKYLEELKTATLAAAPAPVAHKKKKKSGGFRIKL